MQPGGKKERWGGESGSARRCDSGCMCEARREQIREQSEAERQAERQRSREADKQRGRQAERQTSRDLHQIQTLRRTHDVDV
jgi:hypothetical protein